MKMRGLLCNKHNKHALHTQSWNGYVLCWTQQIKAIFHAHNGRISFRDLGDRTEIWGDAF